MQKFNKENFEELVNFYVKICTSKIFLVNYCAI